MGSVQPTLVCWLLSIARHASDVIVNVQSSAKLAQTSTTLQAQVSNRPKKECKSSWSHHYNIMVTLHFRCFATEKGQSVKMWYTKFHHALPFYV